MTVTTSPVELRMKAAIARAQGLYAQEAQMLQEAIDNNTPARRDTTAASAAATDETNRVTAVLNSRKWNTSGGDGRVAKSGPVS